MDTLPGETFAAKALFLIVLTLVSLWGAMFVLCGVHWLKHGAEGEAIESRDDTPPASGLPWYWGLPFVIFIWPTLIFVALARWRRRRK